MKKDTIRVPYTEMIDLTPQVNILKECCKAEKVDYVEGARV